MLEISISQAVGGPKPVTIMYLKGNIDAATVELFDMKAREIIESGAQDVLLDLSDVQFVSSAGLRSLHKLFYDLHPEDSVEFHRIINEGVRKGTYKAPHMKLLNPSSRVMEFFEMSGVEMYITILRGDVLEALDDFD
jgi:anti-anti-sigma regulatory factor